MQDSVHARDKEELLKVTFHSSLTNHNLLL